MPPKKAAPKAKSAVVKSPPAKAAVPKAAAPKAAAPEPKAAGPNAAAAEPAVAAASAPEDGYEGSPLSIADAAGFIKALAPADMQSLAGTRDEDEQLPARMMLEHVGDKDTSWANAAKSLRDGANYKKEILDMVEETCASTRATIQRLDTLGRLNPVALRDKNRAAFAMAVFMEALIADAKGKLGMNAAGPADAASGEPPSWPITIPFMQLETAVETAFLHNKTPLIVASGKVSAVDAFFMYKACATVDAKMYINKVSVKKEWTFEDAREDLRTTLASAIKTGRRIHVAMMNSAVAFKEQYCDPDYFPAALFNNELWTDEANYSKVLREDDLRDWPGAFPGKMREEKSYVLITSDFSLDSAREHLPKALPHFGDMALIVLDPDTVA